MEYVKFSATPTMEISFRLRIVNYISSGSAFVLGLADGSKVSVVCPRLVWIALIAIGIRT